VIHPVPTVVRAHAERSEPAATTSPDDSSDSESESDTTPPSQAKPPTAAPQKLQLPPEFDDEDEDGGPSGKATAQGFKSANEMEETDAQIMVPDVAVIGPDEHLEPVGQIMSVLPRSVIVRGLASDSAVDARALDAGSLLVFDDRQVLGYVSHFCFSDSGTLLIVNRTGSRDVRADISATICD
jgi:H/ACA ribonucleoprotein complex non-core subunit NAF1